MRGAIRLLVATLLLLFAGPVLAPALAQDNKGWLGVETQDVTKAESDQLGWDSPHGAKVTKAPTPGSPAEKAGIRNGDIILAIDRTVIDNSADVDAYLAGKQPGTELRLQVLSAGRERRVTATLATRPAQQVATQVIDSNDKPILQLDSGAHMALIKGIAFTPDGTQLVTASDDKTIRVWDWKSGKTIRTIRGQVGLSHEGKYFSMALSPDGRLIAAGGWLNKECAGRCGEIRLFDFSTGKLVGLLSKGHVGVVSGLAFSRDGKLLMSGSGLQDLTAIIWDVDNRRMLHQLRGHTDQIYALGFSPDKERAYSGAYDRTVKMWSVRDGKEIMTLTGHKDKVQALAVSPTDGTLATGSWDGETRLWDGRSGRYIRSVQNQGALVGSLGFTPDGKLLVSGTGGTAVAHVWEVATGKTVATYTKHDNVVVAAAISPDGRLVATAGGNAYPIHIWETTTGQGRQILEGTGKNTWSVGFARDGKSITWGASPHYVNHNARGPLELQLRLPAAKQSLGQPEPVGRRAGLREGVHDARLLLAGASQGRGLRLRRLPRHPEGRQDGRIDRARSHLGLRPLVVLVHARRPDHHLGRCERDDPGLRPDGQEGRRLHRPRERDLGAGAVRRRSLPALGCGRPDRAPVEPEDARADRDPVPTAWTANG